MAKKLIGWLKLPFAKKNIDLKQISKGWLKLYFFENIEYHLENEVEDKAEWKTKDCEYKAPT